MILMKITPLEIRQKTFEKNIRGFDKDEVNAFLTSLSSEWEKLLDEIKETRFRLENSEKEVAKLREVESSLYKTLKTAEDTGANLIENSRKEAALQIKESQLKADVILNEATNKARAMVEEAERRAFQVVDEIEQRVKELMQHYRGLMQHRDNLSADLSRLASELHERAERLRKVHDGFNPEQFLHQAKNELKTIGSNSHPHPVESTQSAPPNAVKPEENSSSGKSFFDQI